MTRLERIPLDTLLKGEHCQERLKHFAMAVKDGALFIYPTETIYGIGGVFNVPGVKENILLAKQKPPDHAMILIAPDRSFFSEAAVVFPPCAERLAQAFWPGMLTVVLPSPVTEQGIAVRVSRHPFITALFRYIDSPIFSTSANRSGEEYVNDIELIESLFVQTIDFLVDAGPLQFSLPSTVVRIGSDDTVTVLREGAVSSERIFNTLG